MKVTLTAEAGDGQLSHVEAEGPTYESAKKAAEARIPNGSKAIVIRTAQDEN
ncbi:hypothetical protein [Paenarthrobacter aromaticivorans]|uniref:DUF2188 domain-containing protein n=1 Tax=Paenarthrobacter aromaticivorans TaxID=2849150 RepID=A0ABS6IA40_9MICC|nr:hypothetical protein [Paenarthrobacter sp. MMS21-TAE1-1]MBU8868588.1 hypothetical protein [Paenarthrobacter sp. MMS21-TAE1-1]